MDSKGYSLVEMIMVIFLIGMLGSFVEVGSKLLMEAKFQATVTEVERGLNMARQMAVGTGRQYNVLCIGNRVLIRRSIEEPLHRIYGGQSMQLSCSTSDKLILFDGHAAPSKAGTITVKHKGLKKQARITVRIATGKTTVYIEPLLRK